MLFYFNIIQTLLVTAIGQIFAIYLTVQLLHTNYKDLPLLLNILTWNFYLVIPITIAIYYGSKVTENVRVSMKKKCFSLISFPIFLQGKKMSSIIGKMMNSCEDDEILNRVSEQHQTMLLKLFILIFHAIDETFLT